MPPYGPPAAGGGTWIAAEARGPCQVADTRSGGTWWGGCADGTCLRADVYVPRGSGPYPTLVCRTPYNKERDVHVEMAAQFAGRGYLAIVQDVRGRYAPRTAGFGPVSTARTTATPRTATTR